MSPLSPPRRSLSDSSQNTNWRDLYCAAILELEKTQIPPRIAQAEKVIVERARELFDEGDVNADERQALHDIDLVILCHTIPEDQKVNLIASMKQKKRRTPVISIHADGEADHELVDGYVHSLDGPEALLACIAQVLDKSSGLQFAG